MLKNVDNVDKYKKRNKCVLVEFPLETTSRRHGEPKNQSWHEATSPTTNRRRVGGGRACGSAWSVVEKHWALGPQLQEHGCVNPSSGLRGRPWTINTQAINDLEELLREAPSLFLDENGEWLALYHDMPTSTTALHYNLHEHSCKFFC